MPHALSGKTVRARIDPYDSEKEVEYQVEDLWEIVAGESWMISVGNPAAIKYALRSSLKGLPLDNDVLYGKVNGMGELVHVSEILEES